MNVNWVAQVYRGTLGSGGEKIYCGVATGYPVAPNRVITVGHLLEGECHFVEVWFRGSTKSDPIEVSKKWDLRPEFDIAVLECQIPKDIEQNTPLRQTPHNRIIKNAECMGFPYLNKAQQKPDGQRELTNLRGDITALGGTSDSFQFRPLLDLGEKEKIEKGWRGISGGPVFVKQELVGILAEYLGYATVAHFKVVPLCRLLGCEKFREALGATSAHPDHRRFVEQRVRSILGKMAGENPKASRSIRRLELSLRDDIADMDELDMSRDPTETIVESLFGADFCSAVAKLNAAYEVLSDEDPKAADHIASLTDHLAPYLIPNELAAMVWQTMATGQPLFVADASKAAMIETLMALADRREVRIAKPVGVDVRDYYGKSSLRVYNPAVTDPSAEALARDFLRDLCESGQVADPESQGQTLGQLIGRFIGLARIHQERHEVKPRSVYVIHWLPENSHVAQRHVEAFELIVSELKKAKNAPRVYFALAHKSSNHVAEQEILIRTLGSRFSPKAKAQS